MSISAVSLALRDSPKLPPATRKQLQAIAAKMGYRPDPFLSALVAYRTTNSPVIRYGVLAWVDVWPDTTVRERFPGLWAGASKRAESMGWQLEEFRMADHGGTAGKFSKILRARGIEGALVAPMPGQSGELALNWPWFSAVTVGHTLTSPRLHRVTPHQMYNMQLLMRELYALGYRRPGLVIEQLVNERTHHYWTSAFLDAQMVLPKADRIPYLVRENTDLSTVSAWRTRHQPDVIIATRPLDAIAAVEAAGLRVPDDIGVATPAFLAENWKPDSTGSNRAGITVAGIDEHFEAVGAAAIESIVAMINRHDPGVPLSPKHILIEGNWNPGQTVRRMRG